MTRLAGPIQYQLSSLRAGKFVSNLSATHGGQRGIAPPHLVQPHRLVEPAEDDPRSAKRNSLPLASSLLTFTHSMSAP